MKKIHCISKSTLIAIIIMILGTGVVTASDENSAANGKSRLDVNGVWEGRGSNNGVENDGVIIKLLIQNGIIQMMNVDYHYTSIKECDVAGVRMPKGVFIKSVYSSFSDDYPVGLALTDGSFNVVSELSESSGVGQKRRRVLGKISKDSTFTGKFELSGPCVDIVIPWKAAMLSDANSTMSTEMSNLPEVHAYHMMIKKQEEGMIIGLLEKSYRLEQDFIKFAKMNPNHNGDSYQSFAKQYPTLMVSGYDMGWFRRGEVPEAIEKAAFAMKPGEFSRTPIETKFGYHIIYIKDRHD